MMLLKYILRKNTKCYKFTKSQEKINHLKYVDDIKLFAKKKKKKKEKELETLIFTIR